MIYDRRLLAAFNAGTYRARSAYAAAPSTFWCAIRNCWNEESRGCWGVCMGHRQALRGGAHLRLDDQVPEWPVKSGRRR